MWRCYDIEGQPPPLLFCVMAPVPANDLIRRTIKPLEADSRMPAILDEEGKGDNVLATWLGEDGTSPDAVKALLKTMEA